MDGTRAVVLDETILATMTGTDLVQALAINGDTVDTTTDPFVVNDENPTRIGAGGSETANFCFPGEIAEILIYDSVLSLFERNQVETYLSTKWAIPLI